MKTNKHDGKLVEKKNKNCVYCLKLLIIYHQWRLVLSSPSLRSNHRFCWVSACLYESNTEWNHNQFINIVPLFAAAGTCVCFCFIKSPLSYLPVWALGQDVGSTLLFVLELCNCLQYERGTSVTIWVVGEIQPRGSQFPEVSTEALKQLCFLPFTWADVSTAAAAESPVFKPWTLKSWWSWHTLLCLLSSRWAGRGKFVCDPQGLVQGPPESRRTSGSVEDTTLNKRLCKNKSLLKFLISGLSAGEIIINNKVVFKVSKNTVYDH